MFHFVQTKNLPFSTEDVKRICSTCQTCTETKPSFHRQRGNTLIKAIQPMERISMDFKGPLSLHAINKYIFTAYIRNEESNQTHSTRYSYTSRFHIPTPQLSHPPLNGSVFLHFFNTTIMFCLLSASFSGPKRGGDEEMKIVVRYRLHSQPAEFYKAGIHAFICRCNNAIEKRW